MQDDAQPGLGDGFKRRNKPIVVACVPPVPAALCLSVCLFVCFVCTTAIIVSVFGKQNNRANLKRAFASYGVIR